MVIRALANYLGIEDLRNYVVNPSPSYNYLDLSKPLSCQLLSFFDIDSCDKKLRSFPNDFEKLRNNFVLRSELKLSK